MSDQDKICQQAKRIMDSFMQELAKAEEIDAEFAQRREENIRAMQTKTKGNEDFSSRMLKNAPAVKDGCVLAEKKKW